MLGFFIFYFISSSFLSFFNRSQTKILDPGPS